MLNLSILFPAIGLLIFLGLFLLIIWLWAIVDCIKSKSSSEYKLMWLLIIIFLNIIGAVLYFIFGDYKSESLFKQKGKYLTRSSDNKMVGGVCGGLAEYFGFDPAIVRILWVVFTIFVNGVGILLYIVAWIAIPSDKSVKGLKSKDSVLSKNKKSKSVKVDDSRSDYVASRNVRKKNSVLGVIFSILVLVLVFSFVLFFVFIGNLKYGDVKQVSVKNLVVDVRSDVSEKVVVEEILNSHNYKNFNGYDLKLIEVKTPLDDACTLFERDPYGLKIYDSGCREFVHEFSVVSDSFQGYRVNTLTSGGRSLKMTFTELKDVEEKVYCSINQRNADFCIELFSPVCGFNDLNQGTTFSNSCFACSTTETVFYVDGECI